MNSSVGEMFDPYLDICEAPFLSKVPQQSFDDFFDMSHPPFGQTINWNPRVQSNPTDMLDTDVDFGFTISLTELDKQ